jgi:hypothetical protein
VAFWMLVLWEVTVMLLLPAVLPTPTMPVSSLQAPADPHFIPLDDTMMTVTAATRSP